MRAHDRNAWNGPGPAGAARALLLLAILAAPWGAQADGKPGGGAELRLGLGDGSRGAPELLLGGGLAIFDDGATRFDVQGQLAFGGSHTVLFQVPFVVGGSARLQTFGVVAEATAARRFGRFEPWAGLGLSVLNAGGEFEYECYSATPSGCHGSSAVSFTNSFQGSYVAAPTVTGGLRVAVTDQFLLEGTFRWIAEGESRFEELPVSATVGGFSGMVSVVWRMESRPVWMRAPEPPPQASASTPPPAQHAPAPSVEPAAQPAAPPAVAEATALCPAGRSLTFAVHEARRYRCWADPVRGGFFCEPGGAEGQFVDPADCEAVCRGGAEGCRGGAAGAACERCVATCAAPRSVACGEVVGARELRCRVAAGTFGLGEERLVPATCAPLP